MYYIFFVLLPIILYFLKKYINGGVNNKTHDLTGQFIIITGASSGIGKVSALHLINSNAKVIFACRNEERAKKSMEEIPINLKQNAEYLNLDLCNFESIINFTNIIKEKYPKIDILMNNAGAQPQKFIITKDNYESSIQGNFIGPFLLTLLLINHMNEDNYESSIQGNFIGPFLLTLLLINHMNEKGRIINVSSIAHAFFNFDKNIISIFDNYKELEKKYFNGKYLDSLCLYSIEKTFILYGTFYLKNIFEEKNLNLKIVSLHPGVVNTNFMRFLEDYPFFHLCFKIFYPFFVFFTKNSIQGSQTQLFLSYVDYNELINGGYYSDCKLKNVSNNAKNKELNKVIIDWVMKGLKERLPNKDFEI